MRGAGKVLNVTSTVPLENQKASDLKYDRVFQGRVSPELVWDGTVRTARIQVIDARSSACKGARFNGFSPRFFFTSSTSCEACQENR
jgi:hypothetical protein